MKRLLLLGLLVFSYVNASYAVDGIYIGGQVGLVGLTGAVSTGRDNNIGFGGDLGIRTNSLVDLVFSYQRSTHSGLTLQSIPISADVHVGNAYDFDFTLGAGPGFYFWDYPGNGGKFGLNFGGAVDLVVEDHFKVGVGSRYHAVFGGNANAGSYYTIMLRVGYLFGM
jgi:hypothetical protein